MSTAVAIFSPQPPDTKTENSQRRVSDWFKGKKIKHKIVDAVEHREERIELTNISKVKGNYPQIFIVDTDEKITYIGGYEELESMLELNNLDKEILEKNPDLKTFDMVFGDCKEEA